MFSILCVLFNICNCQCELAWRLSVAAVFPLPLSPSVLLCLSVSRFVCLPANEFSQRRLASLCRMQRVFVSSCHDTVENFDTCSTHTHTHAHTCRQVCHFCSCFDVVYPCCLLFPPSFLPHFLFIFFGAAFQVQLALLLLLLLLL